MKKKFYKSIQFGLISAFVFINTVAQSATYTAITSGNWSSITTWGGTAPSLTNTGDYISIPLGINVTMDNNVTLSGLTAEINVAGTLSASSSNTLNVVTGI